MADVPTRGGGNRDRTGDLRLAKPTLSQLSYAPTAGPMKQFKGFSVARLARSRAAASRSAEKGAFRLRS